MQRSYINLMDELSFIMKNRKDFMRAKAYSNAGDSIANFKGIIQSPNDIKGRYAIGKSIQEKLEIFTKTGTLPILEEENEVLQQYRAMWVFMDIYGVGLKKAQELINEGIYTIEDLVESKLTMVDLKDDIKMQVRLTLLSKQY